MRPTNRLLLAALLAALRAGPAGAQALQRGFELERAGRPAEAAETYLTTVRSQPANIPALLGLERVLVALGRQWELLPLVQRGLAADSANDGLRALLVRTYVTLGFGDSAETFVRRWADAGAHVEGPYRELALAYQDGGRLSEARRVLLTGRRAVGSPDALAVELAELAERDADWEAAAREWAAAVAAAPTYLPTAAERLRGIPLERRPRVLSGLTGADAPVPVRRLAAELVLGWGDPARAWEMFEGTVERGSQEAVQALRRFADLAGAIGTPAGQRARGLALGRFADLVPPPLATRMRADAARALLDAGDWAAASRMLETIAGDRGTPADVRAASQATLIRALIGHGDLGRASALLESSTALAGEERLELQLALGRAHLRGGDLAAADSALAGDVSVEAMALRGWVALYRGDLGQAGELLRDAGPYAGPPGDATDRSQMLALLQRVTVPHSAELGAALLLLARGDSAGGVAALRAAAQRLDPAAGRPEVLLLAGQVAARLGGVHDSSAVAVFADVVRLGGSGAAPPAAELEWARLLIRRGATRDAIAHLEHLILTYPESAVVPQARRELERAHGVIPQS